MLNDHNTAGRPWRQPIYFSVTVLSVNNERQETVCGVSGRQTDGLVVTTEGSQEQKRTQSMGNPNIAIRCYISQFTYNLQNLYSLVVTAIDVPPSSPPLVSPAKKCCRYISYPLLRSIYLYFSHPPPRLKIH